MKHFLISFVSILATACVTESVKTAATPKGVGTKAYKTAAGDLRAINDGQLYSLKLGDKIVYQDLVIVQGLPKINRREKVGKTDVFVVERYAGSLCPVTNAVIAIHPDGKFSADKIGNCMSPQIEKGRGYVSFCYPGFSGGGSRLAQRWVYRDGQLRAGAAGECGGME